MTLLERYESLQGRCWHYFPGATNADIVDTVDHLPFFREVAQGNVLEIGVDVGNSTTAFLLGVKEKCGHVFSIDIRQDCGNAHRDNGDWTFICGNSANPKWTAFGHIPERIDVLYVDGDHSYEGASGDLKIYGRFVRKGGLILVHDVEHPEFPGVRQAFDEYPFSTKEIRSGSWGLGVIRV